MINILKSSSSPSARHEFLHYCEDGDKCLGIKICPDRIEDYKPHSRSYQDHLCKDWEPLLAMPCMIIKLLIGI